MRDDHKIMDKIHEKKIGNYVGQPTTNNQEFLKAKTFQQAIQDYRQKRQNDKKFKNMLETDEKLQYKTGYS